MELCRSKVYQVCKIRLITKLNFLKTMIFSTWKGYCYNCLHSIVRPVKYFRVDTQVKALLSLLIKIMLRKILYRWRIIIVSWFLIICVFHPLKNMQNLGYYYYLKSNTANIPEDWAAHWRGLDTRISCGQHSAATCATCGRGPDTCHGDCAWAGGRCHQSNTTSRS